MSLPSQIIGTALSAVHLADNKERKEKKEKKLQELADSKAKDNLEHLAATAVGEVSYVDAESGFILIRQATGRRIVPSTALLSKNPTGSITAKLLSSPANKGSFVAADILSGNPERGNPVLLDPDAKPKTEPKSVLTPIPTANSDPEATPRQAPKIESILPPLDALRPPSGGSEMPLPNLPE
jgi:hypothetical protein